jgi:hypothetical protein
VSPRYPADARGVAIDLTAIEGDDGAFIEAACRTIEHHVRRLHEPGMDVDIPRHISLFALAPIPLLVFLGSRLGNKIPMDIYQHHRDTETWTWKADGVPIDYAFRHVRAGSDRARVALILSLSGVIHVPDLPAEIDGRFSVYEITVAGRAPSPAILRLREDLDRFKDLYSKVLRSIYRDHGALREIHLFPAVPAPVAVLCGRELLPKVDPTLCVYDADKAKGGFTLAVRINER